MNATTEKLRDAYERRDELVRTREQIKGDLARQNDTLSVLERIAIERINEFAEENLQRVVPVYYKLFSQRRYDTFYDSKRRTGLEITTLPSVTTFSSIKVWNGVDEQDFTDWAKHKRTETRIDRVFPYFVFSGVGIPVAMLGLIPYLVFHGVKESHIRKKYSEHIIEGKDALLYMFNNYPITLSDLETRKKK